MISENQNEGRNTFNLSLETQGIEPGTFCVTGRKSTKDQNQRFWVFFMLFVFTVSLTLWKTSDQGLRQRVLHPFPQISSRVTSLIPHNK